MIYFLIFFAGFVCGVAAVLLFCKAPEGLNDGSEDYR